MVLFVFLLSFEYNDDDDDDDAQEVNNNVVVFLSCVFSAFSRFSLDKLLLLPKRTHNVRKTQQRIFFKCLVFVFSEKKKKARKNLSLLFTREEILILQKIFFF